jgi:hypothetical protein
MRASPRYWVYGAASEILFSLGEYNGLTKLPMLAGVPGGDWPLAGKSVALDYRRFLEPTNT